MAMTKEIIEIIMDAKDIASGAVKNLKNNIANLTKEVQNNDTIFGNLATTIGNFKALVAASAAALGIGAIVSEIKSAVDETVKLGSEVGKLQRMTGMSAEAASELIAVADQVGVSFEALQGSVVAVTRKMGGLRDIEDMVMDASGKSIDVFEKFGITIKNTDGTLKPFSAVFEQIRTKIQSTSSETERLAIATQFFRGGATELMPLLTMSAEKYKELAADARKYNLILTQDNVNAVKAYVMAMRDMEDVTSGAKVALGTELIPVLTEAIKWFTENAVVIKDYTKQIGIDLVEATKAAIGVLSFFKGIVLGAAAGVMELFAATMFATGQIDKAKWAYEKSATLLEGSVEAFKTGVKSYQSLGDAAAISGKEAEKAADKQKQSILTYEQWYKNLSAGSEEYIKIKQKEITELESQTKYEKALLNEALANKTITMEQYLAKYKKLDEDLFQAKLVLIDEEIEAAKAGGEKQFTHLAELYSKRNVLIKEHATDEVKAEMEAAEKIRQLKQDEFSAWKELQDLKLQSMKAANDLQIAMDEEAVRAGVMRESEAMQRKLDMMKGVYAEEINLAAERAQRIADMTGLITDKDKAEYAKALSEKAALQTKYELEIIKSEQQISEARKTEELNASKFIAEIMKDRTALEELDYQEKLKQLNQYYQQRLITEEQYQDALDELEETHMSSFKAELQERSDQLNQWVDLVQSRLQKTQAIIDSFNESAKNSWQDVKDFWGDSSRALTETTDQVVWQIRQLNQQLKFAGYEQFWNAVIFGKRLIQITGETVYEWMSKVRDYINYVKNLMTSLQDQISSYRMQLMQLRGDRLGELDLWYKEEKTKLEEKYKDELGKTEEFYEAKSLLDELYAEKKEKLLKELKNSEEDYSKSSSSSLGGLSQNTVKQLFPDLSEVLKNLQPQTAPAATFTGNGFTKTVNINANLDISNNDQNYIRRLFEDSFWPMLKKKFELMGINLQNT